jgi:tetratricopeptide (TPR) repeat protein
MGDPQWMSQDLTSSPYLMGPVLVEIERRLLPREMPFLERRPRDLLAELESQVPPQRHLLDELRSLARSFRSGPKLWRGRNLLEKAMGQSDLREQLQTLEKAIEKLEAGLALDPYSFRTSYHLGEAYMLASKKEPGEPCDRVRLESAERHFIESARVDGPNPYLHLCLAFVEQQLGRPEQAIAAYRKATEKFTKFPEAYYGMGQCHLLLRQDRQARELLLQGASSDLLVARERLDLFADLLAREGPEAFARPLPEMPLAEESPAPALSLPLPSDGAAEAVSRAPSESLEDDALQTSSEPVPSTPSGADDEQAREDGTATG